MFEPEEIKIPVIESILSRYPGRRFILVGDSGEKAPEVYGQIARSHSDQVVRIFIRNVQDSDMSKERLANAFKDVGGDRWEVFKDAGQLRGVIIEN